MCRLSIFVASAAARTTEMSQRHQKGDSKLRTTGIHSEFHVASLSSMWWVQELAVVGQRERQGSRESSSNCRGLGYALLHCQSFCKLEPGHCLHRMGSPEYEHTKTSWASRVNSYQRVLRRLEKHVCAVPASSTNTPVWRYESICNCWGMRQIHSLRIGRG